MKTLWMVEVAGDDWPRWEPQILADGWWFASKVPLDQAPSDIDEKGALTGGVEFVVADHLDAALAASEAVDAYQKQIVARCLLGGCVVNCLSE